MHPGRKLLVVAIAITVFLGAILASDPRFISHSALLRKPLLAALIYSPTIFFAIIAAIKWRNGRVWPMTAFAVGLMCTGLFHQFVASEAYGNPGYMAGTGHIAAPVVSLVAYLAAFLGGWAVAGATRRLRRAISHDDQEENSKETQGR